MFVTLQKEGMKEIVKPYLRFSRKEAIGMMVLLLVMLALLYLPKWYVNTETIIIKTKPTDSSMSQSVHLPVSSKINKPFFFNPNTIGEEEWEALGVPKKTIRTILNYRNKGGMFRTPTDIYKIWGIPKEIADKLLPYISLPVDRRPSVVRSSGRLPPRYAGVNGLPSKVHPLNINTASDSDWEALPGIGKVLAARIIRFRDKLGGFKTVEEIAKTYGLSDSIFQLIKPGLYVEVSSQISDNKPYKININKATEKEMVQAGFEPYLAQAICLSKKQEGYFKTLADLKRIIFINEAMYIKLIEKCTVD